jgi:hypothetical protein
MKRSFTLSFLLLMVLLGGCTREGQPADEDTTGPETWVTLPFSASAFGAVSIETRSDTGIIGESRVKNIFLFIFNEDGTKRLYAHFFDSGNLGTQQDVMAGLFDGWWVNNTVDKSDTYGAYTPDSPDDSKWTNGGIRIKAPQYTGARLYAIANIDGDMINVSPESLNLIRTESQLLSLTARLHQNTIQRNGYFPMTGFRSPVKIVGNSNKMLWSGGSGYTEDWYLPLERMDAKIQFNIQVPVGHASLDGEGDEAEYRKLMSFKPESWQVVNVPKGCTVFEGAVGTGPDAGADGYFDSMPIPTEITRGEETQNPVYGFTFYMMENRESTHRQGSTGGDYHKRDLRFKDPVTGKYDVSTDRRWENAPEAGTYVIIKGTLNMEVSVSSEAKDQTLCADVTYIIHLGDFAADRDNYDILRNTYYTYTVNILGVDKILLEVTTSQPDSPLPFEEANSGAMGGVSIAKESTYTFDAHYGQRVFSFDEAHIDLDHCYWYVKTPYGKEGIPPRVGDADVPSGFDYKWVHFRVNDPDNDPSLPYYRAEYGAFPYRHNNHPYPGDGSGELMDVVQFCQYLRQQKALSLAGEPNDFRPEFDQEWYDWAWRDPDLANGISGCGLNSNPLYAGLSQEQKEAKAQEFACRKRIYVTVYVDEFYYDEHPITHAGRQDFWKTFCNQPNRMMFLLCDSYFSLDRESTATGSVITIRQRAIQTPYNLGRSAEELPTAWGTEVVDETEGLVWFFSQREHAYSRGSNHTGYAGEINPYIQLPANSRFNGRYNSASNWQLLSGGQWVSGDRWDAHLDFTSENDANYIFLKDDPDDDTDATMRWSCLMRNRDNDGDGIIDPEEIRWYMASSEQIIDLYLGGQGLSDEAMTYSQSWADRNGVYPAGDPFAGCDRWRLHYISSTINRNTNTQKYLPDMIRAEEGPNIGNGYYHMDVYWDNSHKQGRFTTRCVRNLGMDEEQLDPASAASVIGDVNSLPVSLVIATPSTAAINANTTYTYDCRNVNEKSLRYFSSVELEPENEFGQSSRLWKRFQTGPYVDISTATGSTNDLGINYRYIYNTLLEGKSPCPEGYRVPNIREAAVMMIFSDNNWWNSCRTTLVSNWIYCGAATGNYTVGGNGKDYASTGNANELKKVSWNVKGKDGNITIGSGSQYIRCVRDLPEE